MTDEGLLSLCIYGMYNTVYSVQCNACTPNGLFAWPSSFAMHKQKMSFSKTFIKRPQFCGKKLGCVFFSFFIQALLRPQIAIQCHWIISPVNFRRFGSLQIKICGKKLYGHNHLGMLNHIGFQNFKKVEFWLKNRHFKNVV